MKLTGYFLALAGVSVSSLASAREAKIACLMTESETTTNNPSLDRRVNSARHGTVYRHYVFDEQAKVGWLVVDGERQPMCYEPYISCVTKYNATSISMKIRAKGNNTDLTIDRMTGSLNEAASFINESGGTYMTMRFSGRCSPETISNRRF
jgi:hypothetical protein